MSGCRAAVDCGTNSTRLLVVDGDGSTVERLMRITRLGRGVDATGRLAADAVEATLAVLREYRATMDRLGVERVRMTATSAARDAANRDDFLAAAEAVVGVRPELLTGEEEGRLSFLGATGELDPADGPFLVVDIGGGSTEFALGTTAPDAVVSVDMGCVRMTERFLHHDPPRPEELSQAISVARDYLEDVARALSPALGAARAPSPALGAARALSPALGAARALSPALGAARALSPAAQAGRLVGLAGTVTTVAAVELGLPQYDRQRIHHFVLTRAAVEDVFRTLATETRAQRIANPGLEEARADVIVGGIVILAAVMRFFEFGECLVSEADILDGLVRSLDPAAPPQPEPA